MNKQSKHRPKKTLRVCRDCGQPFEDTREGVYLCRACAQAKKHRSTLMERTCKTCGKTFSGGPRAYYWFKGLPVTVIISQIMPSLFPIMSSLKRLLTASAKYDIIVNVE